MQQRVTKCCHRSFNTKVVVVTLWEAMIGAEGQYAMGFLVFFISVNKGESMGSFALRGQLVRCDKKEIKEEKKENHKSHISRSDDTTQCNG